MPQFVLMLRDAGFPAGISPEEIQSIIERYGAWMQSVRATGQKLFDGEGRVIVRKDGGVAVTDGPYVETKEYLGGLTIVDVPDEETARMWAGKIAVACGWPQEVRRFKPQPRT